MAWSDLAAAADAAAVDLAVHSWLAMLGRRQAHEDTRALHFPFFVYKPK